MMVYISDLIDSVVHLLMIIIVKLIRPDRNYIQVNVRTPESIEVLTQRYACCCLRVARYLATIKAKQVLRNGKTRRAYSHPVCELTDRWHATSSLRSRAFP